MLEIIKEKDEVYSQIERAAKLGYSNTTVCIEAKYENQFLVDMDRKGFFYHKAWTYGMKYVKEDECFEKNTGYIVYHIGWIGSECKWIEESEWLKNGHNE